jgi:hypothetical protein
MFENPDEVTGLDGISVYHRFGTPTLFKFFKLSVKKL